MKASILFSGGKDSCLAAKMLSVFFDIELITASFGLLPNWEKAEEAAKKLKFSFKVFKLDKEILERAAERTVKDGFPNNGIKFIHQKALEEVAQNPPARITSQSDTGGHNPLYKRGSNIFISDGIRRDDKVPVLSVSEIRSLEDKFDVHYIQPLAGYSWKTIDILIDKFFVIEKYKSASSFVGSEYEFELREIIKRKYGEKKIKEIFPQNHTHSLVISVKK
jgi:predicted subunit of tRNA(5-methylaminomethyl-2-thiouridylate) methyltransferase